MSLYKRLGKPVVDVAAAAVALPLLSPVLLMLAVVIAAKLGRPVLFAQERSGRHGRPFRIIKFRSMTDEVDDSGKPLPDGERLTRFGRWLRASSLDELPSLWNVIRGEMSLVGPRPLHKYYDPLYSLRQKRRLEVRPGLTGWAQVNGRNAIGWPEKLELDVWYVDNQSFWLDIKVLFATLIKVLKREGINSADAATMQAFTGETGRDADVLLDRCSEGARQSP